MLHKTKKSRLSLVLFLLTFLLLIFTFGFIYLSKLIQKANLVWDIDDKAQLNVPKDVENAVDAARQKGLPVLGIRADGPGYQLPILMYHYVEYVADRRDTNRVAMDVPPNVLEAQIKTLVLNGYSFITPSDLADILDGIKEMPGKPIMLTFDDGHRDFYTDAMPILRKYNVKSAQYVISGFLGRPDFLTKDELIEIAKSGLVEIGDHTVDHIALAGRPQTFVKKEMTDSKIALESLIGIPITTIAYPYGSFDLTTIQVAKSVGFRTGFSTIPGTDVGNYDRFFVHRLRPGTATGQNLINLISPKK